MSIHNYFMLLLVFRRERGRLFVVALSSLLLLDLIRVVAVAGLDLALGLAAVSCGSFCGLDSCSELAGSLDLALIVIGEHLLFLRREFLAVKEAFRDVYSLSPGSVTCFGLRIGILYGPFKGLISGINTECVKHRVQLVFGPDRILRNVHGSTLILRELTLRTRIVAGSFIEELLYLRV